MRGLQVTGLRGSNANQARDRFVLLFHTSPSLQAQKAKDGKKYAPIADPPPGYVHDKWKTMSRDHVFQFHAYTTSFDGADDSDGDGDTEDNDKLGIPEWVAFEVRKKTVDIDVGSFPWKSEETLNADGVSSVAPKDDSYKHAKAVQDAFPVSLT